MRECSITRHKIGVKLDFIIMIDREVDILIAFDNIFQVEFLWQLVLQMLDLLSSKKKLDNASEEAETSDNQSAKRNSSKSMNKYQDFLLHDDMPQGLL